MKSREHVCECVIQAFQPRLEMIKAFKDVFLYTLNTARLRTQK